MAYNTKKFLNEDGVRDLWSATCSGLMELADAINMLSQTNTANLEIKIKPIIKDVQVQIHMAATQTQPEVTLKAYTDNEGCALFNIHQYGAYTISFDSDYDSDITIQRNILITMPGKLYRLAGSYHPPVLYTVVVDKTNTNPDTCCSYEDDAAKIVAGDKGWEESSIFSDIKPCVFKNGKVNYYLKKQDFTVKENGASAILTGVDGDVMIEFPRFGYRIYNRDKKIYNDDGTIASTIPELVISITNDEDLINNRSTTKDEWDNDVPPFQQYAFTKADGTIVDKLYIGAYMGTLYNNKAEVRSILTDPNIVPTASKAEAAYMPLENARTRATAAGFSLLTYQQLVMLQALFILKYKNLNCQTSIGRGYNGKSSSSPKTVGSTAMKGMDYGATSNASVKFLGIEDMWGHMWQWAENLHFDAALKATLDGPGAQQSVEFTTNVNELEGMIKTVYGTTELGFLMTANGGDSNKYFCDRQYLYDGTADTDAVWTHGGSSNSSNTNCGIFCGYTRQPTGSGAARIVYM